MKEYFPENGLPILKNWISSHFFRKNEAATVATTGDYADLSGTDNVATKSYVAEQIDAVQLGGTNMLLDTNVSTNTKVAARWNRGFSDGQFADYISTYIVPISDPPISPIRYGFQAKIVSMPPSQYITGMRGLTWYYESKATIPMIDGKTYTASCWARATAGKPKLTMLHGNGSGYQSSGNIDVTDKWERYAFTFVHSEYTDPDAASYNTIYFGIRSYSGIPEGSTLQICGFKLELGNKPTDWSPAPEDVDAKINSIEIGGRNYFGFNKKATTRKYYPDLKSEELIMTYDPSIKGYTIKANKEFAGGPWHYFGVLRFGLQKLGIYTVSMDITSTNDTTAFLSFCDIHTEDIPLKAGITTHLSYTFDTTNKQAAVLDYGGIIDYHVAANSVLPADTTISFSNVKVELGNKATDWTPAPEDLQSAMFDANGNVKLSTEDLRKLASALKTYLQ